MMYRVNFVKIYEYQDKKAMVGGYKMQAISIVHKQFLLANYTGAS